MDARTPIADKPRLVFALLYAAGRFVPVPLLDDLAREEIALRAVLAATESAGRAVPRRHLTPLAAPASGCLRGCFGLAPRLLLAIVLFPIRKLVNLLLFFRHFCRDVVEIVLLGRLVDRALARGEIDPSLDEATQRAQATVLRAALDRALDRTDLTILGAGFRAALGPLRGVMFAALSALRAVYRGAEGMPAPSTGPITETSSRLERAFDQPEVRALVEGLDAKIEAALAELRAPR